MGLVRDKVAASYNQEGEGPKLMVCRVWVLVESEAPETEKLVRTSGGPSKTVKWRRAWEKNQVRRPEEKCQTELVNISVTSAAIAGLSGLKRHRRLWNNSTETI